MGILNVTPDSFSDGGRFDDAAGAVAEGLRMWDAGADIIDVGGESTRPGSDGVDAATEMSRVIPVVAGLTGGGAVVSVDTSKPEVAAAAVDAGARVVNDITALASPGMAEIVASAGCGVVLMHMQGEPRTMQEAPTYADVAIDVRDFLVERAAAAEGAGIRSDRIAIDPGIGFGKTVSHNLELLARGIPLLATTGYTVLVGASRKSFLAAVAGLDDPLDRDAATAAVHALAIAGGASVVRVHDVAMAVGSARAVDAIVRALVTP
jgi:dihydropteroate synthase